MVDYYTELKIDKNLSTEDINRELSKLERIWIQREVNNPEKSTKVLSIIHEARAVFKNDQTRHEYDKKLTGEDKRDKRQSKEEQNRIQMDKWKNEAITFFNSKQYDLAYITVNKALSSMSSLNIEDASILSLAADIYRYNGEERNALNYINRAIIIEPEDPMNYLIKAAIVGDVGQKRNNLKTAIDIADRKGFLTIKKEILGVYAHSLYFDHPQDKTRAGQYAREALNLGETWGNAQNVLDEIDRQNELARQRKIEEDRRTREIEEAKRKKAEEEERKRKQIEQQNEAKRRSEEEYAQKLASRTKVLGILNLLAGAVLVIFELKSLAPPKRNYLDEPPVFLSMYLYSFVLAFEFNLIPENRSITTKEENKSNSIAVLFMMLGILDIIVYTIAYIVRRFDFGALIMFPLVGFGSYFISMGIVGFIAKIKKLFKK